MKSSDAVEQRLVESKELPQGEIVAQSLTSGRKFKGKKDLLNSLTSRNVETIQVLEVNVSSNTSLLSNIHNTILV